MSINVISEGFATTIQDLGRPGYYHLGIPLGGAMDRFALRCANLLVGNQEGAACLECVFVGPQLEFERDTVIAVCGAEVPPKLDGESVNTWQSIAVKQGQTLSFDFLRRGARFYIAVAGGIDTKPALGSRSTYVIGSLGGVDGRAIRQGDVLPVGNPAKNVKADAVIPVELRRAPDESPQLRVLPGLYWHRITEKSRDQFFEDIWTVAPEADRMGYRFKGGSSMEFVDREQPFGAGSDPSNITDACYPYGSIQVPSGKEPIVLHRDAVSGGGYFMIGTVISADMDFIGQLAPNAKVQFVKVNMETALEARRSRNGVLNKVRELFK